MNSEHSIEARNVQGEPMTSEHSIEMRNVHKVFYTHHFFLRDEDTGERSFYRRKTVHAARQISFQIDRGEIFGLLGPNGAGKTTTVKMISGLIRPTAGAVFVDGLNVDRKRLKALRKVGVVLEGTRTSIWPLTPLENLTYYGNLRDVRGPALRKRAIELLEFVGLKEKIHVQVRKLSRGQKQKLAICIGLIADPPVLLLDEPTTGLDVQSSRAIKDSIIDMAHNRGKSVLVTTHDMHVAQELCDYIGIINEGNLIACKPTKELIGLFSDFTFVFHVDRFPPTGDIAALPGVEAVNAERLDGELLMTLRLGGDADLRSETLYTVVERLRTQRIQLRSISQQKSTLESVFLRLTANNGKDNVKS